MDEAGSDHPGRTTGAKMATLDAEDCLAQTKWPVSMRPAIANLKFRIALLVFHRPGSLQFEFNRYRFSYLLSSSYMVWRIAQRNLDVFAQKAGPIGPAFVENLTLLLFPGLARDFVGCAPAAFFGGDIFGVHGGFIPVEHEGLWIVRKDRALESRAVVLL
jgi:hypothetical protein